MSKFENITDELEKAEFINQVLTFLLDANKMQIGNVSKIINERDKLQEKVDMAQKLIDEAHAEAAKTNKATTNDIKRKLQIVRDRVVAISSTTQVLFTQISESKDERAIIDTLNNLVLNIGIITAEMTCLGLWDTSENKPELSKFSYPNMEATNELQSTTTNNAAK